MKMPVGFVNICTLRQRGSLTVWFTEEAIAAWKAAPRTTPGGQPHYSDLAITTALTLRAVFRLALRQTEGLIGSVLQLLSLDLPRDVVLVTHKVGQNAGFVEDWADVQLVPEPCAVPAVVQDLDADRLCSLNGAAHLVADLPVCFRSAEKAAVASQNLVTAVAGQPQRQRLAPV